MIIPAVSCFNGVYQRHFAGVIILESRGEVCMNIYWTDPSEFLSRDRDCN